MSLVTVKVLLVNDCLEEREIYLRYLLQNKQHKYRILEASTGEEAVLLCRQQFLDVIVINYLLPDMDWLAFLNNLTNHLGQTNFPVIILTEQKNEKIAAKALKEGATDYLVKNKTSKFQFIKAVENILEKTRLTRELSELEKRTQERTRELQKANQELQITLEELQVTEQELLNSNEELTISRQAIELERQRYQDLFEFAPDGYLVTDTWGKIQEANRTAATLLCIQQQHLIGKPLLVFIPKLDRKAFRTKLTQLQEVQDWEVYLKPRSRNPFPAMLAVSSIHDANGQQVGWRWLLRDISTRKQIEQRLEAANDQLEKRVEERTASLEQAVSALQEANQQIITIWESMTDAYTLLDREWRVVYSNPTAMILLCQLTNLQPEEILGKSHWDLFPWTVGQAIEGEYRRAMAQQVSVHLELFYEPSGNWFEIHAYPSAQGLGLYYRDISYRKQAEAALQESEEKYRTLFNSIELLQKSITYPFHLCLSVFICGFYSKL